MVFKVYFEDQFLLNINTQKDLATAKTSISKECDIPEDDFYLVLDGRKVSSDIVLIPNRDYVIRAYSRILGGKGGFGSMLRAIGAQIEKTTNREACRDLSGRRLRDINEEKRLRKWLESQAERDKEAADRKKKRLERLLAEPKVEICDPEYDAQREALPERVSAAVDAGWMAASTSHEGSSKRKCEDAGGSKLKKKKKLWIDAELSDMSSIADSDEEIETSPKVSTDSGNESDRTESSGFKEM